MSIRPFRDINRKKTKVINVGKIKIGGDNPISVQSMTNTLTTDVKETIKQINKISVLIDKKDIKKALIALHKEFELGNKKWVLDRLEISTEEKQKKLM